jgi:hypothetical protein
VSLAFGWAMPGYVTSEMAQRSVTTPITKDQLVQADLLINPGIGPAGHAVIFDHWADPAHTSYWGYEQSGDGGTHYRQIPYPYFDGYPMSPYRYNRLIIGPVTHPNGDYDGDGKTDQALFRPADGTWYIRHSSDQSVEVLHWGQKGDIPVPGDYDGDHKTDEALYRNGMWYIRNSSNGSAAVGYRRRHPGTRRLRRGRAGRPRPVPLVHQHLVRPPEQQLHGHDRGVGATRRHPGAGRLRR